MHNLVHSWLNHPVVADKAWARAYYSGTVERKLYKEGSTA